MTAAARRAAQAARHAARAARLAALAGRGDTAEFNELSARQAALVDALVRGAAVPAGFDANRIEVAALALRRKRAGEVARAWPMLAASSPGWPAEFVRWAAGRTPHGAFVDGWECARASGALPSLAAEELARVEVSWTLRDGAARQRGWPALRRSGRGLLVQIRGRVFYLGTLDFGGHNGIQRDPSGRGGHRLGSWHGDTSARRAP